MAARHLGILHHEVAVLTTDGHLEVELHPPPRPPPREAPALTPEGPLEVALPPPARPRTGFHHNRWQPSPPGLANDTTTTIVGLVRYWWRVSGTSARAGTTQALPAL